MDENGLYEEEMEKKIEEDVMKELEKAEGGGDEWRGWAVKNEGIAKIRGFFDKWVGA